MGCPRPECLEYNAEPSTGTIQAAPIFHERLRHTHKCDIGEGQARYTDPEDPSGPPSPTGFKLLTEPLGEEPTKALQLDRRKQNDARDPFISRLPPELASHIFTTFLPIDVDNSYSICCLTGPRSSPAITPLRLGAVCQAWREIAWSTPALWSSIAIDMYAPRERTANLVREWLGRSGQLPLRIRLYAGFEHAAFEYCPAPSHRDPYVQKTFAAVNHFSKRWTYVDLELPASFMRHVCCFTADPAQPAMVKTLKINLLASEVLEPPLERSKQINLNGIISPTKLLVHGLHLAQVGIQWNNLTHVEAFDFSVAECLDLLDMAPRMTHFTLTRLSAVGVYHASGHNTIFCHSQLRSLTLKAIYKYAAMELNTLFERTSFPALTSLTFEQVSLFVQSDATVQPLLDHIARSATRLLELDMKISSLPIDYEKVTALLQAVPTVEALTVEFGRYEGTPCLDPILAVLSSSSSIDGAMVVPSLKSLKINKTRFSWDLLFQIFLPLDVLSAFTANPINATTRRRNCLSSLQAVLPWTKRGALDHNIVQKALDLRERGFEVQITDHDGHDLIDTTSWPAYR